MKGFWIFRAIVIVSGLVFAPVCLPCHGQSVTHAVTVNVPFGFEMGDRHFAPGSYTITTPTREILEIRGNSNVGLLMMHDGQSFKPTKTAKVVFDRYGDYYFLRQVWFNAEETTYLECPQSKSEKQAKRAELASNSKKPSNVELAVLRIP